MARKKTETVVPAKKTFFDKIPPKAALAVSVILILVGIIFTCVAIAPRKTAIGALENFSEKLIVCKNGSLNSDCNGYPVIVSGKLDYSENGAVDAVLGVNADSPILYRISEMYQWTVRDGNITAEWSEELIESPDSGHTNPSSYPSNIKSNYYVAENVKIGDFGIPTDLLLLFENKKKLETLPEIDVRGFKTVGNYITNSDDISSPQVGDVRVRYEYIDAKEATVAGKQRSSAVYKYANYEDVPFFLALEGILDKSDVISEFRARSEHSVIWLLVLSVASITVGGFVFFYSMCKMTGYKPSLAKVTKKLSAVPYEKVALCHSVIFAVLLFGLVYSAIWASVYEIGIVIVAMLIVLHFTVLIPDMIKNMPRRQKNETEYIPIIIKRDEESIKKNRR